MSEGRAPQLPNVGDLVGGKKFKIEGLIGQGGMGAVFSARHIKLGHEVAIKIMFADTTNAEAGQRFVNEGRAAAMIQNEHVVRVSDVDEENGYAYMVLELLKGEDLSKVLERERRLPPAIVVSYMMQALEGVGQAHDLGIVHRDLKPSNLYLVKRRDGSPVVKVLDFGISKSQASSPLQQSPSALTSTKAMLGSPLYMSPEQLRSSKSVDRRADIWAFGIIMFELLSGTLPFMGDNLGELFAAILENDAPSLRDRVPELPADLEAIVHKCLQRKPDDRFQNASELSSALAAFAAGGASAIGPMGTRMLPPGAQHAAMQAALAAPVLTRSSGHHPSATPQHAHAGAVTGGGTNTNGPVAKGTMAIGSTTPQPAYQTTGNNWQSTGNRPKTSNVPMLAALAGLGTVILLIGVILVVSKLRSPTPPPPSGVVASAPPPTTAIPVVTASATSPTPATTASVTASTTVEPATTAATTVATAHVAAPTTRRATTPTTPTTPRTTEPAPAVTPKKPPVTKPPGLGSEER